MSERALKRILVTIDGSERSIETVRFLTGMPALLDTEIDLFHVFFQTHESYYRLAEKSVGADVSNRLRAWEKQMQTKIENHMEQCRQILLDGGYHPDKIRTIIRPCRDGIARDIVEEAGKGYEAVVLRRRGMSALPTMVMGSVALKLYNGIQGVPLILAGRQAFNHRILIGVDRPEEAFRAVEFVGKMVSEIPLNVGLISVLRRDLWPPETFFDGETNSVYQDLFDDELAVLFDSLREKLEAFGIKAENIESEIVKHAFSRAGAIVEAADRSNYSTIVIGRRRVSRMNNLFIGRVSNKIIQIGPKQHFWIVN